MDKEGAGKKKTCFVVGPIGEDGSQTRRAADWLLNGIIRPVFERDFQDIEVVRSDTITTPGMIDIQMINHLINADLVIADMSERNPNAFYEMGIRHMANKPIVHMFSEGTAIPFDVAPHRAIKFSIETFEGLERAKRDLKATVEEAIKPGFVVENPVTRAIGVRKLEQEAPPAVQVLYEEVAELRRAVTLMQARDGRAQPWGKLLLEPGVIALRLKDHVNVHAFMHDMLNKVPMQISGAEPKEGYIELRMPPAEIEPFKRFLTLNYSDQIEAARHLA